jgi:pyrroline-5-carboxylate reductase
MEKSKITIRIDTDILEQFKQMVSDGQGYQSLINQALREWLVAQGIKDLVRQELKAMAAQIVASIQDVLTSSREHT